MEQRFLAALAANRALASELGVRIRPVETLDAARQILSGHRESDGFARLADLGHLEWSLEALAVDGRFTALFTDGQANTALSRLLSAGYRF